MPFIHDPPLIGIVGVCASGKTTLILQLQQMGFHCRHIAQEHSYVQDMWKRLTNPDILICLEVDYAITKQRRNLNWTVEEYQIQLARLEHARTHADLVINTSTLTTSEVTATACRFIEAYISSH